jgi:hypothetical protein
VICAENDKVKINGLSGDFGVVAKLAPQRA